MTFRELMSKLSSSSVLEERRGREIAASRVKALRRLGADGLGLFKGISAVPVLDDWGGKRRERKFIVGDFITLVMMEEGVFLGFWCGH